MGMLWAKLALPQLLLQPTRQALPVQRQLWASTIWMLTTWTIPARSPAIRPQGTLQSRMSLRQSRLSRRRRCKQQPLLVKSLWRQVTCCSLP